MTTLFISHAGLSLSIRAAALAGLAWNAFGITQFVGVLSAPPLNVDVRRNSWRGSLSPPTVIQD